MYIHNLDPVLLNFGSFAIRWYSLAYIFGILIGWWLGKNVLLKKIKKVEFEFDAKEFDNYITYLIISILIGGRIGYILFYNLEYYILNPLEIFLIWKGGMSFHGALIGVVVGSYLFAKKVKVPIFFLLDIVACVAPIGIFLGRIANFINGELIGKATNVYWAVIFPQIDNIPRHPSQLYEAFLEGFILFVAMNFILSKKNYKIATCSFMFLIFYGFLRIISELFREPDIQIGYLYGLISMGTMLSILMIIFGIIIFLKNR